MNRLLTLDDLCDYYSNHKNIVTYNADKNHNTPVVVQLEGTMTFSDDNYDPEMSLLRTHLKSCHIGTNRNHSNIKQSVMEEATSSIYNRPILGFIHKLSDDTYDFAGHEMFINDQGELEYEEIPVGCIPESGNAHLVYDKENDKTYLEVDGVIFEEYTRAAEILKEKKESKVSVELALLDYSYNPKNKEMEINRFYFSGITILGKDRYTEKPIEEGMYGSKITLKDFKQNNSMFSNQTEELKEKLVEMQESINTLLSRFNIEDSKESIDTYGKEEIEVDQDILVNEEVTETEEVEVVETEEVVEIETDSEEIEETEEVTETESTEEVTETEAEESEDPAEDETPEVVEEESEEVEEDDEPEETDEDTEDNEVPEEEFGETEESSEVLFEMINKSFEINGRKFAVSFELSHNDIEYGLYNLLGQYEEIDNDWYFVRDVYDDRFVFQGCWTGKIFGQKYSKDGDTVALEGERYELFEELLTVSEKAELESMRSNYSSIQTELNSYKEAESFADKMTVFEDESYVQFLKTPEFKELMEEDNVKKYSKEELEDKASIVFAKLVKKNKTFALDSSTDEKPKAPMFAFGKIEQKSSFLDGLLNQKKTK